VKVALKLFASLIGFLPPEARAASRVDLEVAPGTTVLALIGQFRIPPEKCSLVLVNGAFVEPEERDSRVLADGDVLAIWPPVGGG
jgi:thiamine biosynthesis protein ThiS